MSKKVQAEIKMENEENVIEIRDLVKEYKMFLRKKR